MAAHTQRIQFRDAEGGGGGGESGRSAFWLFAVAQIHQDWRFSVVTRCEETWADTGNRVTYARARRPNWCLSESFSPSSLRLSWTGHFYPRKCVCVRVCVGSEPAKTSEKTTIKTQPCSLVYLDGIHSFCIFLHWRKNTKLFLTRRDYLYFY